MAFAVTLHLLAALIWVGGMFFAYMALRPAAVECLDPPLRLQLWIATFRRFFLWVWLSVITLLATGYWMVFEIFGGFGSVGIHVHIMHGAGILMVLIYMHVFFAAYRGLKRALSAEDIPLAAAKLAQIRVLVGVNLSIGIGVVSLASAGRYFA